MSLRIVAGSLGGRAIEAPAGRRTRPTGARVREAWFSALGDRIQGAEVLDLFAGSGALGIEALSRGAAAVHFVEEDRQVFRVLKRNISRLELDRRARLHRGDVFRFLSRLEEGRRFDLVLADPPYGRGLATRLVDEFRSRPFASFLSVEHGLDEMPGEGADRRRRYGDTMLSFYSAAKGGDTGES
jgi:16S rRNA (guanine(966)-N(2))-methyltransferase RsmD